jgi:hypothetical protein
MGTAPAPAREGGPGPADTDVAAAIQNGRLGDALRATCAFGSDLLARAGGELCSIVSRPAKAPLERVFALWTSQSLPTLLAFGLLAGIVLLFIWSYYGAAIMRLAAVEYALGERIEMRSAAAYTRRKHQSFYGPPLGLFGAVLVLAAFVTLGSLIVWNLLLLVVALVGLAAIGLGASVVRDKTRSSAPALGFAAAGLAVLVGLLALIGWLGWRVPHVGEVVLGILSPLALAAGLATVLLGIWLVCGLPLMAGVVATSNVGAFEAWSRSFHYFFMHPWRYAFYLLVAIVHGTVCLAFVYLVRTGAEWAAFLPLSVGAVMLGGKVNEPLLAFFLSLDRLLLDAVVLAFVAGYIFTAHAIIYLLLRRCADGTPITEVHLEPRDRERVVAPPAPPQA